MIVESIIPDLDPIFGLVEPVMLCGYLTGRYYCLTAGLEGIFRNAIVRYLLGWVEPKNSSYLPYAEEKPVADVSAILKTRFLIPCSIALHRETQIIPLQ